MTDPATRIAVLVHEVRSPVAALSAIADAVRESEGGERRELVRLCFGACSAIDRLVTDITVASVRSTPVDIETIARDAALARRLAGGVVGVEIHERLPAVAGDPVRLRQAFDNLLVNAVVHAAGSVEITARLAPATITVSVTDDGPGIPADDLDRIFDPGVRLDATRGGAGLGLAITKAIVGAHGGSLGVVSSLGCGTTFTMTLPRSDTHHPDT